MNDQAAGLRRLLQPAPMHVLPVAGGRHGMERAGVVLNLASAAAIEGYSVLVLDQSKGEVAQALELRPRYELRHWLEGEKSFDEVVCEAPHGVRVLSASRGLALLAEHRDQAQSFFDGLSECERPASLVIVNMQAPALAAGALPGKDGEILLLTTATPQSLTGTYAHIKQLVQQRGFARYRVLLLNVEDEAAAQQAFHNMAQVAQRFLSARLTLGGMVPHDLSVRQAERSARSLFLTDPDSAAARAYRRLAAGLPEWKMLRIADRGVARGSRSLT